MYHIQQGCPGQLPQILAFAQKAFATTGAPVDFVALLPGLYGPGCQSEGLHRLLYEGERLEGLYALKILQLTVAGQPLRVGWLGTVAVSPEARGKGHLQRLMLHANQQLASAGCHLGVLGGQRQRYQRFGYEYGGSQWQFTLSARNLQEVAQNEAVRLEPLTETGPWLQQAWAQYSRGLITGGRSRAGFYQALCSWGARPWAILKNGQYAGYCTVEIAPGQAILREFCPLQGELAAAACKAALSASGQPELLAVLPPFAGAAQQQLAALCERACLAENHSYRVLDWPRLLTAAVALRQQNSPPLPAGELRFALANGPSLRLWAGASGEFGAEVLPTGSPTAFCVTEAQAVRLLLGHDSALVPGAVLAPAGWLPLPLAFCWQDGF